MGTNRRVEMMNQHRQRMAAIHALEDVYDGQIRAGMIAKAQGTAKTLAEMKMNEHLWRLDHGMISGLLLDRYPRPDLDPRDLTRGLAPTPAPRRARQVKRYRRRHVRIGIRIPFLPVRIYF